MGDSLTGNICSFEERLLQLGLTYIPSLIQGFVLYALCTAPDLSFKGIGIAIIQFSQGVLVEVAEEGRYLGL